MADDKGMTVSEALDFLDPPIPRRTLERRLARHTPLPDMRRPNGRGRPAHAYAAQVIMQEHAQWATSNVGKRPTRTEQGEPS